MLLALRSLWDTNEGSATYWPGPDGGTVGATQIVDPWTGTPLALPQTNYKIAQRSFTACGSPYLAAASDLSQNLAMPDAGARMELVLMLNAMPTQLASADEPHWLASFHEAVAGGAELFSLGVTPSGRLCAWSKNTGIVLSPVATIAADAAWHTIAVDALDGRIGLSIDGTIAVSSVAGSLFVNEGPTSPLGRPVRFMLFNGIQGKTRCSCSIGRCTVMPSLTQPFRWPMDEGAGLALRDEEYVSLTVSTHEWQSRDGLPAFDGILRTYTDYFGVAFDLTTQWYDPSLFGYAPAWGPVPTNNPASCAKWSKTTAFTPRDPVAVEFRPVPPGSQT